MNATDEQLRTEQLNQVWDQFRQVGAIVAELRKKDPRHPNLPAAIALRNKIRGFLDSHPDRVGTQRGNEPRRSTVGTFEGARHDDGRPQAVEPRLAGVYPKLTEENLCQAQIPTTTNFLSQVLGCRNRPTNAQRSAPNRLRRRRLQIAMGTLLLTFPSNILITRGFPGEESGSTLGIGVHVEGAVKRYMSPFRTGNIPPQRSCNGASGVFVHGCD